jgi:hypothetical protein
MKINNEMQFNAIVRYTGFGKGKLNNIMNNRKYGFPYPTRVIDCGHCKYRYFKADEIETWFANYSEITSKGGLSRRKKEYFIILSRFVDRTRPKIDPDALILKYRNNVSTELISMRDGEYLKQFDDNYQRFL